MKKFINIIIVFLFIFIVCGCGDNTSTKPDDPIVDPSTPDISIDEVEKEEITNTKLLLLDVSNNYIELLDCKATKLTENTNIIKYNDGKINEASYDDLMIGMNNLYVKSKGNEVLKIIIDGEPLINNIRVGIRKSIANISDESTLYHDLITIKVNSDTILKQFDNTKVFTIKKGTELTFFANSKNVCCRINKALYTFDKRVIINSTDEEFTVTSISRSIGTPSYSGSLEISLKNNKLLLTNDVNMEDYLVKVVPSEMPASWSLEALKAQAVAARTYAYREIYNRKYLDYGYVVDDSESSQVYNNQRSQTASTKAVNETKGVTMFYDSEPIVAYYYSCSSGLTGNGNEVWIKNKVIDDIPYLHGMNQTSIDVDVTNEDSVLSFYKTINIDAPSASSSNFRWLIKMTKAQLRETLNTNIPLMIKGNESSYPILEDDAWVEKDFPSDVGEVKNIKVSERGTSGVVVSLEIECENVTFRIYNQYNIRFTIRPKDVSSTVTKYSASGSSSEYTSTSSNPSILTSGYFAIEINNDEISFYGGGSGHGVGMCQYSANYYAKNGMTYSQILNKFYSGINYVNISKEYDVLDNYENLFN